MKEYRGFTYKITALENGRYHFEVWSPGLSTCTPGLSWGLPRKTERIAERAVKDWIDDYKRPKKRS